MGNLSAKWCLQSQATTHLAIFAGAQHAVNLTPTYGLPSGATDGANLVQSIVSWMQDVVRRFLR